jgi:type II secretory pathway pseudopilin PulG
MAAMMHRQSGVSIVEACVVLVLAGLLVAAARQSQLFVDTVLARTLVAEMREVQTMLYTYRDSFGRVPGDANNDGMVLDDRWTYASAASPSPTSEQVLFWTTVQQAGLFQGPRAAFNAVGGALGVSANNAGLPVPPTNVRGVHRVCSSYINGNIARMMDRQMDDGDATTGKVWSAVETGGNAVVSAVTPTPYVDVKTYTVCMAF